MSNPTQSELEILQILWNLGEATVQTVNNKISEIKPVGYTTSLKMLQIMHKKELLGRKKEGKSHIYFPLVQENNTKSTLIKRLVTSAFGGSNAQLITQLLGGQEISQDELQEIKDFLTDMEKSNE